MKHLSAASTSAIVAGFIVLTPIETLSQSCGDYPLTQAQAAHLETSRLGIAIPDGYVQLIYRCEVNADEAVDVNDIRAIAMNRNQPAAHPDDPMDWDRNGEINILDVRGCMQPCYLPRCAVSSSPPPLPEVPVRGWAEWASCFQTGDFDGDGTHDFAGIFQQISDDRNDGWTLDVVILYEDAAGNTQHAHFPRTGQQSDSGEIQQHLSLQRPGEINLNPGTLTIDRPGVVSYRHGEPNSIYYFENGEVAQAFFGVNE